MGSIGEGFFCEAFPLHSFRCSFALWCWCSNRCDGRIFCRWCASRDSFWWSLRTLELQDCPNLYLQNLSAEKLVDLVYTFQPRQLSGLFLYIISRLFPTASKFRIKRARAKWQRPSVTRKCLWYGQTVTERKRGNTLRPIGRSAGSGQKKFWNVRIPLK